MVNFNLALDQLAAGRSDEELAREIGVHVETLNAQRRGYFPKAIRRLLAFPDLMEALARDARAMKRTEQEVPRAELVGV